MHHLQFLQNRLRFGHTYRWAFLWSCLIVAITATLARATLNLAGALVNKPDLAVLLLLPQEDITDSSLLRDKGDERDYLVTTKQGLKIVRLHKGKEHWYVQEKVSLRE